jgi:hypothetical protein
MTITYFREGFQDASLSALFFCEFLEIIPLFSSKWLSGFLTGAELRARAHATPLALCGWTGLFI